MNTHINTLSADLTGRSLRLLSVFDRLRCERVSPRWRRVMWAQGWIEQRKIDQETLTDGIPKPILYFFEHRFWVNTSPEEEEDTCNLTFLLRRVGTSLLVLNLGSFGNNYVQAFAPEISKSLPLLTRLEELHIADLNLAFIVDYFPQTLRRLKTLGTLRINTLIKLSARCPNLESFPFSDVLGINADDVNEFIEKFPRQKKLDLGTRFPYPQRPENGVSIWRLKQLEVLELWSESPDEKTLETIVRECKCLRKLVIQFTHYWRQYQPISTNQPKPISLSFLATLQHLTVLEILYFEEAFTDFTLVEIANRTMLKRLNVRSRQLTDASIVYLIDRCKSLISLDLSHCPQITERSLEAVVAEVHRRHGNPPTATPKECWDAEVFFFGTNWTKISMQTAREMTQQNSWLIAYRDIDDPREII